ncbi:MAG: hypothetical protein RI885_1785 [Actinomycetota bacterium]
MTATATIDLAAYRANLAHVRDRIRPARLMAVIKGDAYGHGLDRMAAAAAEAGVDLLGVLDSATALAVRKAGIDVQLFAWLFAADEDFTPLVDQRIDVGISTMVELERVAAATTRGTAGRVHLKIDTGLHRNGASAEDWPAFVRRAVELEESGLIVLEGVWTHIGEASDEDDSDAIARFGRAVEQARGLGADPSVSHLAASAAGLARADARFDVVRVGAFTYGIAPGSGIGPRDLGLIPVMTLTAEVTVVSAGRGGSIAVVDAGYLDGIPAGAAGRVRAAVRGARHPITAVRPTATDLLVVGEVEVGDRVTFFGAGTEGEETLQEWADALDTIGEEIVVRIPQSVPRHYVG